MSFLKNKRCNAILSQVISSSGKFLFAGNQWGSIFIYSIEDDTQHFERVDLDLHSGSSEPPISSLAFYKNQLIVGSFAEIYALRWSESERRLLSKRFLWNVRIPVPFMASNNRIVINSLWVCELYKCVFAASGDARIYQIDLNTACIVRYFEGHLDGVQDVHGSFGSIVTASDDGTVRGWRTDEKCWTLLIKPSNSEPLQRLYYGQWMASVRIADEEIVCGGGPKASLWDLRALRYLQHFAYPGIVQCCDFLNRATGRVIVTGSHASARIYSAAKGDERTYIYLDHIFSNSLVWQQQPISFMSIGGLFNKLHTLRYFNCLHKIVELQPQDTFTEVLGNLTRLQVVQRNVNTVKLDGVFTLPHN